MKQLKIGLDFDGVIANTQRTKLEIAAQQFGKYVDMRDCNRSGFIKAGFTEKQYEKFQKIVYGTYDIRPVQGCLTHLRKLIEQEHEISITSYRLHKGYEIIENFLINNRLDIPMDNVICTNNLPKSKFISSLDVFVDDRTEHLNDLRNNATKLILFDRPYNREEKETDGIERVCGGWKKVYREIRRSALNP